MNETLPIYSASEQPETSPLVAVTVIADNGARWVHKDLVQVAQPWADEAHISPPKAREAFGDVDSWALYIQRFAGSGAQLPVVTWNSNGLNAVLDYHANLTTPGRREWIATHPFERSVEWKAWMELADGRPKAQKAAIEALEDRGADIVDPSPAELLNILRTLRTTVNKMAEVSLNENGSTHLNYTDNKDISGRGGTIDLPSEFTIAIPVLKGHTDADGKPVVYSLKVRLRASVTDEARLALRLTIPNADKALEEVFADRVRAAELLLGEDFDVLRAAG